ncbi:MAG: hypothetical protein Q8K70_00405 [Bacteroidota bacterium]|nr:hypothetical protein [Bacteroidota bacterium]
MKRTTDSKMTSAYTSANSKDVQRNHTNRQTVAPQLLLPQIHFENEIKNETNTFVI